MENQVPNPQWKNASHEQRVRIRRGERMVSQVGALDLPYIFGGGRSCGHDVCDPIKHETNGGDCSWGAALVCNAMGIVLNAPASGISTYSLADEGVEGFGKFFTLMIKNPSDPHEAHVIMQFTHGKGTKVRHAEVGGSDNPTLGNGMSWVHMDSARLAEFPIHRHFKGL